MRGIGSHRGVCVAHDLEVGIGGHRPGNLFSGGLPTSVVSGRHNETAHDLRMAHDERPPDQPAEAEAEDIGLADLEMGEQGCDIVGQLFDRHRSIAVGRASVSL
jgi:hypothetical protein